MSVSLAVLTDHALSVSASLDVGLPTGDQDKSSDIGSGQEIWMPSLAVDLPMGDALWVFNIGGEFAKHVSVFVFEVTLACPMGDAVGSIGVEGSLDGDQKQVFLVPGVGFPVAEDVELGIEASLGLNRVSSDWKIGIEVTFEF